MQEEGRGVGEKNTILFDLSVNCLGFSSFGINSEAFRFLYACKEFFATIFILLPTCNLFDETSKKIKNNSK